MATDVLLIRRGKWLVPAEPISEETIEGLKQGEYVTASIRRTRNPGHHRKFFALLNVVFENQTRYATLEHLLDAVKLATGHCDIYDLNGKSVYRPRSISFARMDQTAFGQFYDKVVEFILSKVIPHIDRDDLERRVLDILAGTSRF